MFTSRRKARRISGDEDGSPTSNNTAALDRDLKENPSPNASTSHLHKNRPTSRASSSSIAAGRISLSNAAEDDEDENPLPAVIKPKKPSLARSAISNSALRNKAPRIARPERDEETPSYSSSYLQELKSSTPSTPKDLHQLDDPDIDPITTSINPNEEAQGSPDPQNQDLDLASKLDTNLALHHTSSSTLIPTSTEIAEKKARRSRLAKEQKHQQKQQEYISLHPSDTDDENRLPQSRSNSSSSSNSSSGRELTNYRSTTRRKRGDYDRKATERLVREDIGNDDDNDNAEGYQGSILLTKKSRREALAREKASIAARIHAAEKRHSSDSNFSDSSSSNNDNHDAKDTDNLSSEEDEEDRTAAYEASQLHHGTTLLPSSSSSLFPKSSDPSQNEYLAYEASRPRTPPKITPLPTLSSCMSKITSKLEVTRWKKEEAVRKLEGVQREIEDVRVREEEVRRGLRECGARYEEFRDGVLGKKGKENKEEERGLENLGEGMRGGGVVGEGREGGEENEEEDGRGMGSLGLGYAEKKGLEMEA